MLEDLKILLSFDIISTLLGICPKSVMPRGLSIVPKITNEAAYPFVDENQGNYALLGYYGTKRVYLKKKKKVFNDLGKF